MSIQPKHRARRSLLTLRSLGVVGALTAVVAGGVLVVDGGDDQQKRVAAAPTAPKKVDVAREEVAATPVDVDVVVNNVKDRVATPVPDLSAMTLPQLQTYAVKMQAEFVEATLAYGTAQTESIQSRAIADQARVVSEDATQVAEVKGDEFATSIVSAYQSGGPRDLGLAIVGGGVSDFDDLVADQAAFEFVSSVHAAELQELTEARQKAERLAVQAKTLAVEAEDAESDAQFLLDDIQGRAAKVAAAANKALSGSASDEGLFASAEQTARNDAALKNWREYLDLLDAAKVVSPAAVEVRDPKRLPRGLRPLLDSAGKPVRGVAAKRFKGKTITVLPRETVGAVSRAFAAIGKPYSEGAAGPDTYDCSGMTAAVWKPSNISLSSSHPVAQYKSTRKVGAATAQVGDLVFFADDSGVQQVGLNLGGDLVITADGSSMQVGVQPYPTTPFAVTRATLKASVANKAPATDVESWTRCGGESLVSSGAGMVYPIKDGSYRFSATFGESGGMWASGYHTGLDFAARTGTPVMAAKGGTVSVEKSGWAGPNYVIIDHGDGLQTTYGHMSRAVVKTGDVVKAGALIGAVGEFGNATGPHLHFEVVVGGVKVDPLLFLSRGGGSGGWGGFVNGMIPQSKMCALASAPGHMLRCDASAKWEAMAKAYRKHFGAPLCITDSYRSYAVQVTTYANKPDLAAIPGTSNHGWALAVDLCGGINSFGTAQYKWMEKNAPRFGWIHPDWARQGGGREEPWHWEFGNVS